MALAHDNLINHYESNFALIQHHKYSMSDINQMIPYEREIYIMLLMKYLQEQKLKLQNT